jgi:ABC-type Fe3+-hydroxamate transport system substrate-binding protein
MKTIFRICLLVCVFISMLAISTAAEPVAEDITITISPTAPAPLSTVTINATVSGEDIDEVFLKIKECKDTFCYLSENYTMTEIAPGEYQVVVTLEYSDVNNIGYQLVINSNGTWYDFFTEDNIVYTWLTITPSDGGNGDGDGTGDGTGGTPGFELVLMLVSIAVIVFILQRKR